MVTTDLIIYECHIIIYVGDREIKSIHFSYLVNYCHVSSHAFFRFYAIFT